MTQVQSPDKDKWRKLIQLIKFQMVKMTDVLTLGGNGKIDVVKCWVDASYMVQLNLKSQTGRKNSLGQGCITSASKKWNQYNPARVNHSWWVCMIWRPKWCDTKIIKVKSWWRRTEWRQSRNIPNISTCNNFHHGQGIIRVSNSERLINTQYSGRLFHKTVIGN